MSQQHDFSGFTSPLPHPGELLREEYLPQYGLTPGALAKAMGLKDRTRIERIVREKQPITADTALRLARVFNTSAQYWVNLQSAHDLSVAAIAGRAELEHIRPIAAA
jgi:addiction module HigA family antidote